MKLEVGMYVRIDYHRVSVPIQISRIKEKYYDDIENYYYYITDTGLVITEDNLVKEPSYNPIDLIEVGDYVNGMEVVEIDSDRRLYVPVDLGQPYDREFSNGCFYHTLLDMEQFKIKSIVTKERFKSIKYEVEG